jgi:hypothetical protein
VRAHLPASPARRSAAKTAARRRRTTTGDAVVPGGTATPCAALLDLQRLAGNRAVAQLVQTFDGNGNAGSITLHGQAEPFFDGGSAKVLKPGVARKKGCDCPQDEPCMTGTGTLQVTYKVDVTVTMPDVPGGLSRCQERRVRDFLRNVLGPHEQQHKRLLESYNGTTTRPFSVTACGRPALDEAVNARIQKMQDDEHTQRSADAEKKSAAIDPFDRPVDLNCT